MQPVNYAVISAAGMGTRLGLNMPKCLVKIKGRCVIDYILDLLIDIQQVRIVIGFMEEEVVSHVVNIRPDVVFVRNPNFSSTSNSHSLWLGSKDIQEPFLAIDGDMLIEPASFFDFLKLFDGKNSLIGVSRSKTEEAVFVNLDENNAITSFQRSPPTQNEWCGVAVFSKPVSISRENAGDYVYKALEAFLPLPSAILECYEIDTPSDLDYASAHFRKAAKHDIQEKGAPQQ